MRSVRSARRRVSLVVVVGIGSLFLVGAVAVDHFQPPKTAVVDRSQVFKDYVKTKVREAEMQAKLEEVKGDVEDLKARLAALDLELKQLRKDSPAFDEKTLEQMKLKLDARKLQESEYKSLMEIRNSFLKEISDEISTEIQAFARVHNLDLVLEQQVRAEGERGEILFEWPIVHFAKPELDITKEITRRLNEKYNRKKQ